MARKVINDIDETLKKELFNSEQKCPCCGEIKKINGKNFYKSYSVIYKNNKENRMSLCKDCLLDVAEKFKIKFNSETRGLYELCKLLDVYYEKNLFDSACKQAENQNSNPYQIYFQKVLSMPQYRDKIFIDSESFDRKLEEEEIEDKVGRDVVDFWGEGYSQRDYDFLEREYESLITRYECDSYAQEVIFQEIANQRLDIKKKRASGAGVDKEVKTLQDLLGTANIKPVQESNAMASEQVTFGTLIKKYENEKPIPEPLGEWESADWIKKYVLTWFLGHFSKMMGSKNKYATLYEEEISKYTVKIEHEEEE